MDDSFLQQKQELREISNGHIRAKAVYAAAKLGLADLVGDKPTKVSHLAEKTNTNEDALYRLLRFLSGIGVFREHDERAFSNTAVSEFLKTDHMFSERGAIIMRGEQMSPGFEEILHSIQTLETGFSKRFGSSLFEFLKSDEAAFNTFQTAMRSMTVFEAHAVMEAYDFSKFEKIVDVGGGNGTNLSEILAANPGISGTLFDLESSIEMAKNGAGGPLPRCELVVGDFFESITDGGDLYILKNILHDWYDDKAIEILKNCRQAMAVDSKLIIVERLLEPPNKHSNVSNQDMTMMVVVGGLERREDEFSSLVEQAGFQLERAIKTTADIYVLECSPV
jgi:hypothetical protein